MHLCGPLEPDLGQTSVGKWKRLNNSYSRFQICDEERLFHMHLPVMGLYIDLHPALFAYVRGLFACTREGFDC